MSRVKFVVALLLLAFLLIVDRVDAKRKKKVKKEPYKLQEAVMGPDGTPEIVVASDDTTSAINAQIQGLNLDKPVDKPKPEGDELEKLKTTEGQIRYGLMDTKNSDGEYNRKYYEGLYLLGRNLYTQHNYVGARKVARKIVEVSEKIFGKEDVRTAQALSNYGSACFRMSEFGIGRAVSMRALNIVINVYGENSKEVMTQRGKMMSHGMQKAEGEKSSGFTYEEFEDYLIDDVVDPNDGYEITLVSNN